MGSFKPFHLQGMGWYVKSYQGLERSILIGSELLCLAVFVFCWVITHIGELQSLQVFVVSVG